MGTVPAGNVEAGFAKLQGEDFEYYMQSYSIILGRNSKQSKVDFDLSIVGGGKNISHQHARIFYDFTRQHFFLEVLGRKGCSIEGVLHFPGSSPVKLDSKDLLQIGNKEFYFLLPVRNILGERLGARHYVGGAGRVAVPRPYDYQLAKKGRMECYEKDYEDEDEDEDEDQDGGDNGGGLSSGKKLMWKDRYKCLGYRRGSGSKSS